MRDMPPIAIPAACTAIAVGLLGLVVAAVVLVVTYAHFIHDVPRLITPFNGATINLEPGVDHIIYQKNNGSHITNNNPLVTIPEDAAITLADPTTAQPIAHRTERWTSRVTFFWLEDRRTAIAQFTAPPSGQITIDLQPAPEGQVLYFVPSQTIYASRTLVWIQVSAIAALLFVLLGVAILLLAFTNGSRITLNRHNDTAP